MFMDSSNSGANLKGTLNELQYLAFHPETEWKKNCYLLRNAEGLKTL